MAEEEKKARKKAVKLQTTKKGERPSLAELNRINVAQQKALRDKKAQ